MPKYKLQAPDGRTVTVEGDAPPSEAEIDEIFASLPGREQPQLSPQPKLGLIDRIRQNLVGAASERRIQQGERGEAKAAGIGLTPTSEELALTALGIGAAGPLAVAASAAPIMTAASLATGVGAGKVARPVAEALGEEIGPGVGELTGPAGELAGFGIGGGIPSLARRGLASAKAARLGIAARPPAPPPAPVSEAAAPETGGVVSRIREAAKALLPETEAVGYELLGRKVGGMTGIPGAVLYGGRIGRLIHRFVSAEKKALTGRGVGNEIQVEKALVDGVMKKLPGLTREQAAGMVKKAQVGPPPEAATPAPKYTPSEEARKSTAEALKRAKAKMKLSPEEIAQVNADSAAIRAARAPKGKTKPKVAPAAPAGKSVKEPPAPTAPPIAPAAGAATDKGLVGKAMGAKAELRTTAFARPGGPTDAEWAKMGGSKAKRAWLEAQGAVKEGSPAIGRGGVRAQEREAALKSQGAMATNLGGKAKAGPPPTSPEAIEAALQASLKSAGPYKIGDKLPDGRIVEEVDAAGKIVSVIRPKSMPKPNKGLIGKRYGDRTDRTVVSKPGGSLSAEELSRAARKEVYYKVSRSGELTYYGPQPDPTKSLRPGEGIVRVTPGKEPMVTQASGDSDSNILARFLRSGVGKSMKGKK